MSEVPLYINLFKNRISKWARNLTGAADVGAVEGGRLRALVSGPGCSRPLICLADSFKNGSGYYLQCRTLVYVCRGTVST
jgi:hypothetical protein